MDEPNSNLIIAEEDLQNLAWLADSDGSIVWYNQRWYDYTGTRPDEMLGWGWQTIHDPEKLPYVMTQWKHALAMGKPFEIIFSLKGTDGIYRSFLTRAFPIHDKAGKTLQWSGTNTNINELKSSSEILAHSLNDRNEQMKTILQYIPDAVVMIDEAGMILSWNPHAETIFGWKEYEVLGKNLSETIIPKRHREQHERGMVHFMNTGEGPVINNTIEIHSLRKNSSEFPIELKVSSTKINNRHIFIGFMRDISVRKQTEETIKNKTNQLLQAQQLAHIGSWEWDVPTNKIEWSDELFRIFGLAPQEFEGSYENYLNFIHPDDKKFVDSIIQQSFHDHQPFNFFHKVVLKDGTERILNGTGKVITDNHGTVIKMAGTAQDVTLQKNYETELKASEERFMKIFDNNPIPMSLSEMKTNIIRYVNNNFCTTFGFTKEEVIGYTSEELDLISKEENDKVIALVMSHLNDSRSLEELQSLSIEETEELIIKLKQIDEVKNFEILYTKKDGRTFPALVSYDTIRIGNDRFNITSYQDITERKKAEMLLKNQNEKLEKMNRELQSFAYISSHDLQEPLRKIQTFASRIIETEQSNLSKNSKDYLARMQAAAHRMRTLIQDLLSYSRTNTEDRIFIKTDLKKLVMQVVDEFKDELHQKNAIVEVNDMCSVRIIPFQFVQLMHNLIGNSLKFSHSTKHLHINIKGEIAKGSELNVEKLLKQAKYCHIMVSDNGIGFQPEFSEKIFEVFQRLHGKDEYAGTGIGLAIVKRIVDNHNGTIIAQGNIDEGATFHIYIPADWMPV